MKLGRLFVFASENGASFSPYVLNVSDMLVADNRPAMLSPLSLRLIETVPEREMSFVSDIDGFIKVMQEVDGLADPFVKVKMTRIINKELGWIEWTKRKLTMWERPRLSY